MLLIYSNRASTANTKEERTANLRAAMQDFSKFLGSHLIFNSGFGTELAGRFERATAIVLRLCTLYPISFKKI
jgi:hypothetical protein